MARPLPPTRGPFTADQLRSGDPYELSQGHPISCLPTGGDGARRVGLGYAVVASDPGVTEVGVDVGYSPSPGTLRAPDVAVGNVPDRPGWVAGAPLLALEYAGTGQDEAELLAKIPELHAAGTRWVWVVRMVGPRRVEVYEAGKPVVTKSGDDLLEAPGALSHPIAARALYDGDAAWDATLRNLLARAGYRDLDAVRDEGRDAGRDEGRATALREVLPDLARSLGLELGPAHHAELAAATLPQLETLRAALVRDHRWPG